MGNSTIKLQDVLDYVSTIGDLAPVLPVGGYSTIIAKNIANDVMTELLSERFNWKWNRMIVTPFLTISCQQDYAALGAASLGWLEHAVMVDINNTTSLRKPIFWLECVRDLERTSYMFGRPAKVCWLPNDQLVQEAWPGPNVTFTDPKGALAAPANPRIDIRDASGNILVLTTYGITGNVAPDAGPNALPGATVNDGTAVWTVADPKGQGFRLSPCPPQTGLVYEIDVIAQRKPVRFANLQQTLDPIPDDFAKWFQDGFIAYTYRHATAPVVRARFEEMKRLWLESVFKAKAQGDRERDDAGFIPDRGIMDEARAMPIGPAWPYGPTY